MPVQDNLDQGWIKLYRSVLPKWEDLEYWIKEEKGPDQWSPWVDKPPCAGKLWDLLLLLADQKGEVKKGLTGLGFWLSSWDPERKKWLTPGRTTTSRWLEKLEKNRMITRISGVGANTIKVVNWSAYQRPAKLHQKNPWYTPGTPTLGTSQGSAKNGCEASGSHDLDAPKGSEKQGGLGTCTKVPPLVAVQEKNKNININPTGELNLMMGRVFEFYKKTFADTPLRNPKKMNLAVFECSVSEDDLSESEIKSAITAAKALWYPNEKMRRSCHFHILLRHIKRLNIDWELSKAETKDTCQRQVETKREALPTLNLELNLKRLQSFKLNS